MKFCSRIICSIMIAVLIIPGLLQSVCGGPEFSYAAETDRTKIITVFTEPESSEVGDLTLTDKGVGLDTLVSPAYATGYKITYESSNEDIAVVDETGHIHGRLTGAYQDVDEAVCTVTATVTLGELTHSDEVKVVVKRGYDPLSFYVVLSGGRKEKTITEGSSTSIYARITDDPNGDTREECYFISSDPSVALVDNSATTTRIVAKSPGTATITGYLLDGTHDSCQVTVKESASASASPLSSADDQSDSFSNGLLICCDSSVSNRKMRSVVSEHDADYSSIVKPDDETKAVLAEVSSETDIPGLLQEVKSDSRFLYVQPNYTYQLMDSDPYYTDVPKNEDGSYEYISKHQYFHFQSRFREAWDLIEQNGKSDEPVVVGVVDSGVSTDLDDLRPNLILEDGKYTAFRLGDVVKDTEDPHDDGHGTHVSGIIGAVYGNGIGGSGAAAGKNNDLARVLTVGCVFDGSSLCTYDLVKAIDYAVAGGAKVINLSLGGYGEYDRLLGTVIQNHYYNDKVVFTAAAGNESTDYSKLKYGMSHPSDIKEVISVTNINREGTKSRTNTNYGYAKDIAAPGYYIWSTYAGNDEHMWCLSGTSMSTPVVSSACALLLNVNPDLTPDEVKNILCGTANDSSSYIRYNELGYGQLDAYEAVSAAYKAKEGTVPDSITIEIKEPYGDLTETQSASLTKVKSFKALGGKKYARLNFSKPSVSLATLYQRVSADPDGDVRTVYDCFTDTAKTSKGISYKVGVRKKGGKWKYFRITSERANTSKYKIAVKGSKASVKVKNLKSGKTYYVKVRPYRKAGDKNYYGKWSAAKKVKIK